MLKLEKGLYVWTGGFETRKVPKEAGFRFHGTRCNPSRCGACKEGLKVNQWWTDREECAIKLIDLADAEARQALKAYQDKISASRAVDSAEVADVEIPVPEGKEYLPYQRSGIAYAIQRQGALIADEMGLGKTIQAIGTINALSDVDSAIVICPASLRLNWRKEVEKWLTRQFNIFVVNSTKDVVPDDANLVIVNYESLRGRNVKNPEDPDEKIWEPTPILGQLMARRWDMLVIDEVHRLTNPKSLQTKCIFGFGGNRKKKIPAVRGLKEQCDRQVHLTGTPLTKTPIQLWPILHALNPVEFSNFFAFAKRYCNARQEYVGKTAGFVWKFDGATNSEELQNKLRATVMVRRKKADVLKELPPKRRQVVVLPANGSAKVVKGELSAWKPYEERLEKLKNEADFAHASGDMAAYNKALKELEQGEKIAFEGISAHRREVALSKVPKVIEHLEEVFANGVEKLVVFGHHNDVCDALADHFGDAAVKLTGRVTSSDERQAAVDRFQTDPSCKVFVGSIGAAGVGHTLTAASTVIFAELDWNPSNLTQAEDRCHRIGQTDTVHVQHLVLDGSIDARMAELLIQKQDIADAVLDKVSEPTKIEVPEPAAKPLSHPPLPKKYPEASPEERETAHTAMQMLAGVCDGAAREDGMGFNKLDTDIGHKLAAVSQLTDGQVWLSKRLARKYRRQLPSWVIETLQIAAK